MIALATRSGARSARDLFGSPDDLQFRSCLTLFAQVGIRTEVFDAALDRYFDGISDPATLVMLGK